jgi:hypothetical protein
MFYIESHPSWTRTVQLKRSIAHDLSFFFFLAQNRKFNCRKNPKASHVICHEHKSPYNFVGSHNIKSLVNNDVMCAFPDDDKCEIIWITYKITLISCSITIAVEGKFGIVLAEGVPYIVPMLDLSDDIICLYILQVFSSHLSILPNLTLQNFQDVGIWMHDSWFDVFIYTLHLTSQSHIPILIINVKFCQ